MLGASGRAGHLSRGAAGGPSPHSQLRDNARGVVCLAHRPAGTKLALLTRLHIKGAVHGGAQRLLAVKLRNLDFDFILKGHVARGVRCLGKTASAPS